MQVLGPYGSAYEPTGHLRGILRRACRGNPEAERERERERENERERERDKPCHPLHRIADSEHAPPLRITLRAALRRYPLSAQKKYFFFRRKYREDLGNYREDLCVMTYGY
jgi:hypothetical protein